MNKSKKIIWVAIFAGIIASIAIIVAFLFVQHFGNEEPKSGGIIGESDIETDIAESQDIEETTDSNTTSKGYKIENINGVTYINNILIVNKEYSLPRSYDPGDLTKDTQDAFEDMRADAQNQGIKLWIQSGYRSYDRQEELYNESIKSPDAAKTDALIARPGYSEHQTGLTMDINSVTEKMGEWAEGVWLRDNCYKYGFIIRYPKGKESYTGYSYEPWHIRFVGKDLANKLYTSGECLEEYLGITSEYAH